MKGQFSGKGPPAPAYRIMERAPAVWGPRDPAGVGKVWMEGKSGRLSLQPTEEGMRGGTQGRRGAPAFQEPPQAFSDRPLSLI